MRSLRNPVVLGILAVAVVAGGVLWRRHAHYQALREQRRRAQMEATQLAAQPDPPHWPALAITPEPQIPAALNTFGFVMLQDIWRREPNRNVALSPMSLWFALAMIYNGASGQTRAAMGQALQLGDMPLGDLDFGCQKLAASLQLPAGDPTLLVANSLWLDKRWPFKPQYVGLCRQFFNSIVYPVTIDLNALPAMNAWVSQNTCGRITEIVGPEDLRNASGQIVLILLDTLYFKGRWTHVFMGAQDHGFTRADGSTVTVPLMYETESWYYYYDDQSCQLISLPYGSGRTSMYILLPRNVAATAQFVQALTTESWERYVAAMRFRSGTIHLPRFQVGWGRDLNDHLRDLGMAIAFEPRQADFSEMTPATVWIDKVRQKVWMQVNETGTEVAAATFAGMAGGPPTPKPDPFEMVVDHPFLFAIRDNGTGVILAMGVVTDPTQVE